MMDIWMQFCSSARRIIVSIMTIHALGFGGAAAVDTAGKCGFSDRARIIALKNAVDITGLRSDRPLLETSILSPSGHFRIHYDSTNSSMDVASMIDSNYLPIPGTHRIFAEHVASIFDSVWNAEIVSFGFAPPPSDNGAGGGNEYDIYIVNSSYFGETFWTPDTTGTSPGSVPIKYVSYITIDNDFGIGFRTKGLAAIKVTAAHELFHAIQIGGYGLRDDELYFYEMTAESMESAVYPSVRDYLFDLKSYYVYSSSIPLYGNSSGFQGYERALWAVYLRIRFGIGIIRELWEDIPLDRPLQAMEKILRSRSTSLQREFVQFSLWNIFTGSKADTILYYPDGRYFPPLTIYDDGRAGTTVLSITVALHSFTIRYGKVINENDTIYTIITNTNYDDAVASNHQIYGASIEIYPFKAEGATPWIGKLSYMVNTADASNWNFLSVITNSVFSGQDDAPFPNPFRPFRNTLYFPVSYNESAHLIIYNNAMEVVWENVQTPINYLGKSYLLWSGKDTQGRDVPSGIYFYTIGTSSIDRKGKFAVIR